MLIQYPTCLVTPSSIALKAEIKKNMGNLLSVDDVPINRGTNEYLKRTMLASFQERLKQPADAEPSETSEKHLHFRTGYIDLLVVMIIISFYF